jgi:CheY-like chemotaxis protein
MASARDRSVLVVDDDADLCGLVATVLRDEGYNVRTASNGAEALDDLRAHGVPDLILLDMKMPVMDGWEFAKRLDAEYDHQTPVVVISAAENPGQRAADIGANGWIAKPFDLDGLVGTVSEHVRQ